MDAGWYDQLITPNFLTTFDETLPMTPGFSPAPSPTGAATQLPGSIISPSTPSNSSVSKSIPSSGSGSSGGFTSLFGPRGIAIILGLIFIAGSILLFLGDDIAGAVKIAAKATA